MKSPFRYILIFAVIMVLLWTAGCGGATPVAEVTTAPAGEEPAPAEEEPAVAEPTTAAPAGEEPAAETPGEGCTEKWQPGMPFCEAPMLAAKVASGELPPVEERVPKNPVVGNNKVAPEWLTKPFSRGNYGGTLRLVDGNDVRGQLGHDAGWLMTENWVETYYVNFRPDYMFGNVFESIDISDDLTTFTVHMREGMKFSNGALFDSEDVRFWWQEVMENTELTASMPTWARTGHNPQGNPAKLEVVDQWTFKFIFDGPYGNFPGRWDMYNGYNLFTDSDYLKAIHNDFADPAELAAKIEEQGFEEGEWTRLWGYYTSQANQGKTGQPTYTAWIVTEINDTGATMERNPYYYKVDDWGQQLPYIDKVTLKYVENSDAAAVELGAGNVDMIRRLVSPKNLPLYTQNAEKGGYDVYILGQHASLGEVFLNITYQDPMWTKYVGDKRFREALSMAIDRDAIIDAVYYGIAEKPTRWLKESALEFNPEEAIRILEEEFGMTQKDADGCRLGEDGKPFTIPFEVAEFTGEEVPVTEMVAKFWSDIGICSSVKQIDSQLFQEMNATNSNRAFTWWAHYPRWPLHEDNDYYGVAWQKTYAPLWVSWWDYNMGGGKELNPDATDLLTIGVEPPEEYKQLRQLQYDLWATSFKDVENYNKIWNQIIDILRENVYIMSIVDPVKGPFMISKKLDNHCDTDAGVAITCSWQDEWWYYKE